MVIFTDPHNDNQVMACYTHDTTSTVWAGLGYERHEIADNADINRLARDCRVVIVDGVVVDVIESLNPIQPEE